MAEEGIEQEEQVEEQEAAPKEEEQKIMCFVSKQVVGISETVEIEYQPHNKVRVLPKYIKYTDEDEQAS